MEPTNRELNIMLQNLEKTVDERFTSLDGKFDVTGISQGKPVLVSSTNYATPRTVNAAAVSLTNVMFRAITAGGTASPFTGTSLGNALGNTNWQFVDPPSLIKRSHGYAF